MRRRWLRNRVAHFPEQLLNRNYPVHILLIHQVFIRPEDPGGTRHYEFARHLVRTGHRVTVLAGTKSYLTGESLQGDQQQELEPGLRVVRCTVLGSMHRSFFWRVIGFISFTVSGFLKGLQQPDVDLIWGTSPPLFQVWTAWALARLRRVPWLFEVRDLWPAFAVQVGVLRNPLLIAAARWSERTLYRQADGLMVNSPGYVDHLTRLGVPGEKLKVIPNGVEADHFIRAAPDREFRQAHGLEGQFIALYAGAHGLSNDLGVVVEAARMLRDRKRITFLLVGDGKEKPALQDRARSLGLKNILFHPPVSKSSIPGLLKVADCGLALLKPIPLYATTYPNKVFDYMAAGLPVILAIDGVIRQVVERSGSGVFVPPGDPGALAQAVEDLSQQPERRRTMGERGIACVQESFDRKDMVEGLQDFMIQLTKRGENG